MDSTLLQIILVAALAGFVQGVSGFAFALVATSLWAWMIEPRLLAPTVVFTSLLGQFVSLSSVRADFSLRRSAPFLVGGALGAPVGVLILPLLDATAFRMGIGAILVVYCTLMLSIRRVPVIRGGGRAADGGVGLLAGILGGATGIAGPPIVVWCALRGWEKAVQRATFQSFFAVVQILILGFYVATGLVDARCMQLVLVAALPVVLASRFGATVFRKFTGSDFQTLIFALLLVSGIALLFSGV
jgi:uncharacterized membrane protein YfcA